MPTIQELFPNVNDFLAASPEDIAPVLLSLALNHVQNGIFWPEGVTETRTGTAISVPGSMGGYPANRRREIETHFASAWSWIERNDLIVRAPGMNGAQGFMAMTRKGEAVARGENIERTLAAAAFPKSLLHPTIADHVWRALHRNDLDGAVFAAFKAVEEAVRSAGGYGASDIGVTLMRKAFDKDTGPLRKQSDPDAEREALAHLFAGAIGSYKNPHSHRTVNLTDLREAQEQTLLASHLLSIIDSRRPS